LSGRGPETFAAIFGVVVGIFILVIDQGWNGFLAAGIALCVTGVVTRLIHLHDFRRALRDRSLQAGAAGSFVFAIFLVVLVVASGSENSSAVSEVDVTTSTIVRTTTTATTTPSPVPDRDPKIGWRSLASESSEEFFDGRVVVSLGQVDYDAGALIAKGVGLRLGDARCVLPRLRNGDALRFWQGHNLYRVEVRALDLLGASVVVFHERRRKAGTPASCVLGRWP
jgi:hypothetical protein